MYSSLTGLAYTVYILYDILEIYEEEKIDVK